MKDELIQRPSESSHIWRSYTQPNLASSIPGLILIQTESKDDYWQGKKDGAAEKEAELIRMANALFDLAMDKARAITSTLWENAKQHNITIHNFYLSFDSWDKIKSLIVVKLDDFVDDKIEELYRKANELCVQYNTDKFKWEYTITYYSEKLSKDKIIADGFTHIYEPITESRQTQQESV
jgi:hypothetical protein